MRTINARSLPWPCDAEAGHCSVLQSHGIEVGPSSCSQQATSAALVFYERSRSVWLIFFCDRHGAKVPSAEPLTPETAAELEERSEQHALAMEGRPFRRPQAVSAGKPWLPDEAPEHQTF